MGISDRLLGYLESPRNLIGCAAGTGGLALYFAGAAGPWWPAVVAGLYGAGALLAPRRWPWDRPNGAPDGTPGVETAGPAGLPATTAAGPVAGQVAGAGPEPKAAKPAKPKALPAELRAELAVLRERAAAIGLPSSVDAEGLFAALARAEAGQARQILARELPLALDGYVRARSWETLVPGGVDPTAALKAELERLAGLL
ncbi:hypothetical protein ACIA8O_05115 [Kitasatospora sp. NPDC051853]|uniref:hypothetical protein n=1 Tax=Kitasatospora sp. NPDC051853 TaxID=3364058 RepID=UPI0037B80F43